MWKNSQSLSVDGCQIDISLSDPASGTAPAGIGTAVNAVCREARHPRVDLASCTSTVGVSGPTV